MFFILDDDDFMKIKLVLLLTIQTPKIGISFQSLQKNVRKSKKSF